MHPIRSGRHVALLAAAVALATTGAVFAADPPATLRFAVADEEGRPSDPWVRVFADEVAARSGGTLAVDIVWDAGSATDLGFEWGVAQLLVDGQADLGLTAGRAWSAVGISALRPLQAPFLIDSDELAEAVVTDPLMEPLLAAMGEGGVAGLAVWPEDLRHPVAFEPCIGPITAPSDLQGRTVRAIASDVTTELLATIGATHTTANGYDDLVESCEIQAAESGLSQGASLPGKPTFTADVTFFPKFQVLAANAASLGHLTEDQQAAVRDAASAVRDRAIAEHPRDTESAAAWCAAGGRVVLIGPEGAAAFEAAAAPVLESMANDPLAAATIDRIRALRSTVERTESVAACGPAPRPIESPVITATITPAFGTYRTHITSDDLARFGGDPAIGGTITLAFEPDSWSLTWAADSPGGPATCTGSWAVEDGVMRVIATAGDCGQYELQLVWTQEDDALAALVVGSERPMNIGNERALFESHPFIRID